MNENALSRWTGIAGAAAAVLALIAFAVFGTMSPPAESDSGQTIAKFFADHRTTLAVLIYLIALSLGCNLAFFVGLRDVFRRRAPDMETLVTVGAIGGIVFIAVVYVGFGVLLQLVYREGAGDPATQRTLFDIYTLNITMANVPTAIGVGACSIAVLQSGAFPRWLGWYGFAVAAAHLVGMGALARDGFFAPSVISGYIAPLMFYGWMLAFSALLLRGTAKAA